MEIDQGSIGGGGENFSRVPAASSSCSGSRQRFYIELRPGETTIVSWKRLLRDANTSPPAIEPSLTSAQVSREAQFALEGCFQDDQSITKQNGYFVNTGKSEHKNESISSANCQSKKRRKNMTKAPGETIDDHVPNKHAKLHARLNISAGNAPFMEQSSSQSHNVAGNSECHHDGKLQHPSSSPIVFPVKKSADTSTKSEYSSYSGTSNLHASVFPIHPNETDKQRTGTTQYRNLGNSVKDESEFTFTTHQKNQDKNTFKKLESQAKRFVTEANELEFSKNLQREKKASKGLPDLNIPASPVQSVKSPSMHLQEVSSLRPKGNMLERAIRELEKCVAESRPPNLEVQDGDTSSVAIKRRLPPEVKQKLAKVARLAQSSQGKISEELINRLMGILGHLMQLRTLKRNLREMVLVGLSAKREKADRFQQIKKEVTEMIKLQAAEQRDGSTNVFQEVLGSEEKGVVERQYSMDNSVEDKICDLYDLYVQGMDEDKGPQIRKLYVELAELWPNGAMDNHGIKSAICRAKERRRVLYNHEKVQEKDRRKNLSTLKMEDVRVEAGANVQPQAVRERLIAESNSHILALPTTNMISCTATGEQHVGTSVRMLSPYLKGSNMDLPKQEKLEKFTFPLLKEQTKQQHRELESRVKKLSLKPERESHKSHKRAVGHPDHPSHQLAAPPSCGRPG